MTVHYQFHPLRNQHLEVVAWPRKANQAVTVRQPDGETLKIPLWMVEPAAASCQLRDQVELTASILRALVVLLEHQHTVPTPTPPEHSDAAAPLSLNSPEESPPRLKLEPEREQRLIALMAEAIVAVMQSTRETDEGPC